MSSNSNKSIRSVFDKTIAEMYTNILYKNTYLFYASFISKCEVHFVKMDYAACVHFDRVFIISINPDMFNLFPLEFRMGVLKHEILHIIMKHHDRLEDKDLNNWQLATDCSINQLIDKNHLPSNVITVEYLETLINKKLRIQESADYYYKELIKSKNQKPSNPETGDHKDWNKSKNGLFQDFAESGILKEYILDKIIKDTASLCTSEKTEIPNAAKNILEKMTIDKESAPWEKYLKRISSSLKSKPRNTFKRRNRRFLNRLDIPGKVKHKKPEILVILDVSGSINNKTIKKMLSSIINISKVNNTEISLIQVSSEVHKQETLNKKTKTFIRAGTGGTFLSSALSEIQSSPDIVIILTDGFLTEVDVLNFRKSKHKLMWVITKHGREMTGMKSNNSEVFKE